MAGRTEPGLDPLIGLIANTLVLRADTSGNPAFRDLLARLRTADLAALDHQDLPSTGWWRTSTRPARPAVTPCSR